MSLSFRIASRLRITPEGKSHRSPGVTVAVTGVALAVAVMLISLAVVTGFKNSIRQKLLGLDSAITIAPVTAPGESADFLPSDSLLMLVAASLPDGATVTETLSTTALLKTQADYLGITLRACTPGKGTDSFIASSVREGVYPDYLLAENRNAIVVSAVTATLLRLDAGDKVFLHFFVDGGVRTRPATVAAIYDTSFTERDRFLAFCSMEYLESAMKLPPGTVSAINISGVPSEEIDPLKEELTYIMLGVTGREGSPVLLPRTIEERNPMYFNWLDLLDTNIAVIITLMSLVAAFTLISCLLILILERIRMIGILKALGATNFLIQKIFVWIAMRIVLTGVVVGNILSLGLLLLQQKTHLIPLDPEAYFLDSVPVEIVPWQVIILDAGVLLLAAAVLFIPARIVSGISPASTIRYE